MVPLCVSVSVLPEAMLTWAVLVPLVGLAMVLLSPLTVWLELVLKLTMTFVPAPVLALLTANAPVPKAAPVPATVSVPWMTVVAPV